MRQKTRQIKFYCSEEQFQTMQTAKLRRNVSTQQFMTDALSGILISCGLDTPTESSLDVNKPEGQPYAFFLQKNEYPWVKLWVDCIETLPASTLLALRQLMHDTLKFFQRARLKPRRIHRDASILE